MSRCDIHVIDLDEGAERLEASRVVLLPDERDRAASFVRDRDRDRFTACRAGVRRILAQYLDCGPRELGFTIGSHGKPRLNGIHGASDLHFNVSKSSDLALCAVAMGREIGVDLERIRPLPNALDIAARFFSPTELAALCRAEAGLTEAFFTCWTRKEAFVKALGTGLSHPLDGFSVSLDSGDGARVLEVAGDAAEGARWGLSDIAPDARFAGAVAAHGAPVDVVWVEHPGRAG